MARPYWPLLRAAVLATSGLLAGCVGSSGADSFYPANFTTAQSTRQASSCPVGQIKVCDRRRGVGCVCRSPRHIRAAIGA